MTFQISAQAPLSIRQCFGNWKTMSSLYIYSFDHWPGQMKSFRQARKFQRQLRQMLGEVSIIDGDPDDPSSWIVLDPVFNDEQPPRPPSGGAVRSNNRTGTILGPASSKEERARTLSPSNASKPSHPPPPPAPAAASSSKTSVLAPQQEHSF